MPEASPTLSSAANMTTATVTSVVENLLSKEDDSEPTPIFLQTKTAQGLAGAFVAAALFLTCQQVGYLPIIQLFCLENVTNLFN